jgi:hypothetical protein
MGVLREFRWLSGTESQPPYIDEEHRCSPHVVNFDLHVLPIDREEHVERCNDQQPVAEERDALHIGVNAEELVYLMLCGGYCVAVGGVDPKVGQLILGGWGLEFPMSSGQRLAVVLVVRPFVLGWGNVPQ